MSAPAYLMENPLEVERLESKTDAAATREQLRLVGVREGMRVLDAGSGTAAVAREIARAVGPTGAVVALDASRERSSHGALEARRRRCGNLSALQGDAYAPPLRSSSFDLVWSRFLFAYLERPDAVLAELVRVTRPGGKVVVGEVDGHGLFHHPMPPIVEDGLAKLQRALQGRFDPLAGRKLYHRFRKAGLQSVTVHMLPYHLYAQAISPVQLENWRIKLDTLRRAGALALGGESQYDDFARAFLELLEDPDSLTYSVLIMVEGVRGTSAGECLSRT
jgi:ubiquinone/menaquinone biosynthesis C-methylase UbiE